MFSGRVPFDKVIKSRMVLAAKLDDIKSTGVGHGRCRGQTAVKRVEPFILRLPEKHGRNAYFHENQRLGNTDNYRSSVSILVYWVFIDFFVMKHLRGRRV